MLSYAVASSLDESDRIRQHVIEAHIRDTPRLVISGVGSSTICRSPIGNDFGGGGNEFARRTAFTA